jgi:peptidyl-prolyl cis-trans isomerase C
MSEKAAQCRFDSVGWSPTAEEGRHLASPCAFLPALSQRHRAVFNNDLASSAREQRCDVFYRATMSVSEKQHWTRAIAGSRLVQFLVLGGLIFAFAPGPPAPSHISFTRTGLEALEHAQAARAAMTQLPPEQAQEVDRRAIEDEVLYREAIRLGLEQGDPLVREHLIQKMLLLAEDLGGATRTPTDAELRAYFNESPAKWSQPGSVHFLHVFASQPQSLEALALDPAATVPPPLGEPFALSRDVRKDGPALTDAFGAAFASAVMAQAPGTWSAPLQSKYGWHRVKVLEHTGAHAATFEEVRGQVKLDFAVSRRQAAVKAFLTRALGRYHVDVDGKAVNAFVPEGRLGSRSEPSAEDE